MLWNVAGGLFEEGFLSFLYTYTCWFAGKSLEFRTKFSQNDQVFGWWEKFPHGPQFQLPKKKTQIFLICKMLVARRVPPPPKHKKLLMKFIHCTWSCLIGRFLYQSSEDYIYAIDKCLFWGGISGSKIVFKVGISNHPSASHIQLLQSQDLLSAEGS